MRGILDLDVLCLKNIFKFLKPMDFCSLRQSSTQLRDFVDDHFRSLYFVREQWLDLSNENIKNVNRILSNFGKLVRLLKVRKVMREENLLLDLILTNCGAVLKGLSLNNLEIFEINWKKFDGVFDNLEILELIFCDGDQKCIEQFLLGHHYPNLTTLKVKYSDVEIETLKKFFMRPRNLKKLSCWGVNGDVLLLIATNASEIEKLNIFPEEGITLMSLKLVQFKKLKRLEIHCLYCDKRSIIALIEELSVDNQLENLGMSHIEFSDKFSDSLSNLTNLKELRLWDGRYTLNNSKSMEMLGQKLSKLESFTLVNFSDFHYRNFFASACKSDKFRTTYVSVLTWNVRQTKNFIDQTIKDFIEGRGHRCFVSGDTLCIYLHEDMYDEMKDLLTKTNLQSIKKYGNIKILRANDDAF